MAQIRDIPGNPGRVATLTSQQSVTQDIDYIASAYAVTHYSN